jgi:hypothetical protein
MAVLAAFSGALDHRFALKMMRSGNWYERPRLWVLLVADPSQRKTPIINTATQPLVDYENRLVDKYEDELRAYEEAKAANDGSEGVVREPKPRYVVWDSTVEKLGELLSRKDKGILVKSDEISGWIGSMERYSNTGNRSDRAFWLSAYDGGPRSIDRIRRGELRIRNLSVSILGGIQPTRLQEIKGLTSDGLLQRFLPVMMGKASFRQDRYCDDEQYSKLVHAMMFAEPARLIMTQAALDRMETLHEYLFKLEHASSLTSGFQSFIGKLQGLCGSLALILHLAHDPKSRPFEPIEEGIVDDVDHLVRGFILPHASEFYWQNEMTEGERLRRLASWILTSGKDRILASDLTTNVRDCRGLTLLEINERVSPLVAGGWLQPTDRTPVCRVWKVTPTVRKQLAERVKTEETRKAVLIDLMSRDFQKRRDQDDPDRG